MQFLCLSQTNTEQCCDMIKMECTPCSGYQPEQRVQSSIVTSKHCLASFKGTVPQKSMWALSVHFSEKTTMVPFIWA